VQHRRETMTVTSHLPLITLHCCVLLVWPVFLFGQRSNPAAPADAIYVHGDILTGEGLLSPAPQRASALATEHGLVIAVGSDADVIALRGPKTEVIDLKDAFVMPGFNDAHVHLASAGREKLTIDLVGVQSLAEMQRRIAAAVGAEGQVTSEASTTRHPPLATAPEQWLRGRGWDHMLWASKQLPSRQDLDPVTGEHPAIFTRVDGHIAVANSRVT
jgi:predicted amidohydrolase YtcJ